MSGQPATFAEYLERFNRSQHVTGHGPTGVTMHMPCPFCAAPDFLVHRVIDTRAALEAGAVCKECERGVKAIFTESAASGRVSFEIVQTVGADAPTFLPRMRRVAA